MIIYEMDRDENETPDDWFDEHEENNEDVEKKPIYWMIPAKIIIYRYFWT